MQGLQDVTVNVLQVGLKLGRADLPFLLLLNPGLPLLVAVVNGHIGRSRKPQVFGEAFVTFS